MRITIFLLFIAFVQLNGQVGLQSVLSKFNNVHLSKFNQSNHVANTYNKATDSILSKTITIDGQKLNVSLQSSDTVTWNQNIRTSHSVVLGGLPTIDLKTFSEKGTVISSRIINNEYESMNEELLYEYDDKNRMISMYNKKDINVPVFEVLYDNETILPAKISINIGINMIITRKSNGDTAIYNEQRIIPEDLRKMVIESLGEDATEENILKALGPFGKISNDYSKIYKTEDGFYIEEMYEVDDEGNEVIEKTLTFDSTFKLYSEIDDYSSTFYTFLDNGNIKDITMNDETFPYEYDVNGNLIKEYSPEQTIQYLYSDNKLTQEFHFFQRDYFMNYIEYIYLD